MLYKINKGIIEKEPFETQPKLIVKQDLYDIRNMAVTLLYKESSDQVFRTSQLNNHIDYLYPLYNSSPNVAKNITYPLEKEYNHILFDTAAAKEGTSIIYCNDPAKQNLHNYVFYLSSTLTPYQKEFLASNMKSFLKLQQMTLFIYRESIKELDIIQNIEEYRSLSPYQTLKKMIQK